MTSGQCSAQVGRNQGEDNGGRRSRVDDHVVGDARADVDALTATVRGAVSALTFDGAPLPSAYSTTTDATRAALDALHEAASAQLAALKLRLAHLDRAQDALDLVDTGVRALEAFAQPGGDAAILALPPPPTRKNIADAALKTQRASNNNNNNKRAKH